MKRFQMEKKGRPVNGILVSLAVFSVIGSAFFYGINSMSRVAEKTQLQTLQKAIQRNIALCYAMEGRYPESLAYLKENYALRYDESKYFVGYEVNGENIMPTVTIIEK